MSKKILVADNSKEWRDKHTTRLEEAGYKTHVAQSGKETSSILQSDQDFDGAVLDNNMPPGDDGLALLYNIKEGVYGEKRRQMPVLICSSDGQFVCSTTLKVGGKYIDKSVNKARYLKAVESCFGGSN